MENTDECENNYSLHMFRLVIERRYNKFTDKDYAKKQQKILKASGINQSLNNEKCKDIRFKSNYLGECGWVISPFWEPSKDESWYDTWFWLAWHDSSESIAEYFLKDNCSLLKHVIGYSLMEVDRSDWYKEAVTLFQMKHYTSCAMLLTAILEESIRKCPIDSWRYKVTGFFNDAVKTKVEDYYVNKSIEPLSRYIETVLLLPSMDEFINNYFNSGHHFENGKEPPFLERNWLMHGLTKKVVTESDCLKLFNVICTLHYVLHTVFERDYGQ